MFERHAIKTGDDAANYLLICPQTRSAALIDAGGEADLILQQIRAKNAKVRMIVLTHGHADRWQALGNLRDTLGVPIGIHLDDADMLPLTPNFALTGGQRLAFDMAELVVIHTPGHTPGSVCFLGDGNCFTGDSLAKGAPGDTSTELGDHARLMRSYRERLFTLPDATEIYPGHGKSTTIGAERASLDAWELPSR
jgi:glyoxylase-like metal-dependent hydrolase (beta-lactamase superfamily II)